MNNKEKYLNSRLKISCMAVMINLLGIFGITVCPVRASYSVKSSTSIDLRLILEDNWQEFYSGDQVLLLDMLKATLRYVSPVEKMKMRRRIWKFAQRGFEKDEFNRFFLFSTENSGLSQDFVNIIQNSEFRFTPEFLTQVYEKYRESPTNYDFQAFLAPAWTQFCQQCADKDSYASLSLLLKSGAQQPSRFLYLLYHAYQTHLAFGEETDNSVREHLLPTITSPQAAEEVYQLLQGAYWERLTNKRNWMLCAAAYRVYDNFTVKQWSKMNPPVVIGFAQALAEATPEPDWETISLADWFKKLGQAIKEQPGQSDRISLLYHFIKDAGMSHSDSFGLLYPYFSENQQMFIALHQSTQSPMDLWHAVGENFESSMQVLLDFLKIEQAPKWDIRLWDCLRENYYKNKDWDIQDQLYSQVMAPVLQAEDLIDNPLRKRFLRDVHSRPSAINEAHRYNVAHNFISTKKMTDSIQEEGGAVGVLTFTVETMVSIDPTDARLFRSPGLRAKTALDLNDEGNRIVAYVKHVLGEPLAPLCYALMGKGELTRGVVFSLLKEGSDIATPEAQQFEKLLRRIVELKTRLREKYHRSLGRIEVLDEIENRIIQTMEEAIVAKKQQQILTVLRIALKITSILGDDSYLERILTALREDVFEVSPDFSLQSPPQEDIDEKVKYFTSLHSEDLVNALAAVGEVKYMEMFYRQLYVPLWSIYGFFRRVGADAYILFINKLIDDDIDSQTIFTNDVEALGSIRNAQGPAYINAEEAVISLINHHCSKVDLNLWQEPERLTLNQNVNLAVLHRLLTEKQLNKWRRKEASDEALSGNCQAVARVFLEGITNRMLLMKSSDQEGEPMNGSKWDYLIFLRSLVDLAEIHGSPLPGRSPKDLYTGTPADAEGIKRRVLVLDGTANKERKVDGTLRAEVVEEFLDDSDLSDDEWAKHYEHVVGMAVLLPNESENSLGSVSLITDYEELKGDVFNKVCELLESAQTSPEQLNRLIWLCRLEASVYGLANASGYGYEDVRRNHLRRLSKKNEVKLRFEEFRLRQINSQNGQPATGVMGLAPLIEELVTALAGNYELLGRGSDPFADVILDFYRMTNPRTILETLCESDLENIWFLTTKCREAMTDAAGRKETLSQREQRAAVKIMTALYEVHSFFMPYIDGRFNVDAVFDPNLPYALPLFCMMDRTVKMLTATLFNDVRNNWTNLSTFTMSPCRLKTFLMYHNLLSLDLLETCLDDPTGEQFLCLVRGREIKIKTYNFRLLWVREDRATVSLENLCQEVLSGVDCNRELLLSDKEFNDYDYLEYFFGDIIKILSDRGIISSGLPKNFDAIVHKMAKLVNDKRLKTMRKKLEPGLSAIQQDPKLPDRIREAKKQIDDFPENIQKVLEEGYDYFGKILAEKFRSVFTIQKACEKAIEKVRLAASRAEQTSSPSDSASQARLSLSGKALKLYSRFYESAILDGQKFHHTLEPRMANLFYPPPPAGSDDQEDYRSARREDMVRFIDGSADGDGSTNRIDPATVTTKGLAEVLREKETSTEPTSMEQNYIKASKRLMRCLFVGEYLPADRPFIGDLLWARDRNGKRCPKALPYDDQPESIFKIQKWIFDCAQKYRQVPEIRNVFISVQDWERIDRKIGKAAH